MNSSGSGWCVPITTIIPASQGYMRLPKGKPTLNSELPCCFGVLINYSLPPFKEVVRPPTPSPPYVQLQQQPTWFCRPLRRQRPLKYQQCSHQSPWSGFEEEGLSDQPFRSWGTSSTTDACQRTYCCLPSSLASSLSPASLSLFISPPLT